MGGTITPAHGRTTTSSESGDPPVVDLSVPAGSRLVPTLLLMAGTSLASVTALVARVDPAPVTIIAALLLTAATVTGWVLRPRGRATTVVATGSRLEICRGGSRHVFDLANPATPVDVLGVPGDRGWRVLFYRRGMAPYVLDASMAQPAELMRLLHRHRPAVHYRPR